jgi:hypothetical protein
MSQIEEDLAYGRNLWDDVIRRVITMSAVLLSFNLTFFEFIFKGGSFDLGTNKVFLFYLTLSWLCFSLSIPSGIVQLVETSVFSTNLAKNKINYSNNDTNPKGVIPLPYKYGAGCCVLFVIAILSLSSCLLLKTTNNNMWANGFFTFFTACFLALVINLICKVEQCKWVEKKWLVRIFTIIAVVVISIFLYFFLIPRLVYLF